MKKYYQLYFLFFYPLLILGENEGLKLYIQQALENNLALKKEEISLKKSIYALKEAKGAFLPSVSVSGRHTNAGGGREIVMPVGDLMNPLYSTLNDLLNTIGQPSPFPERINNEVIPFLRDKEQETVIRIIQPLYQPEIFYNYKMKKELYKTTKIEKEIFQIELTADVKEAYYNYLKVNELMMILKKNKSLAEENYQFNLSLHRNNKITKDIVLRSEADILAIEQNLSEAEKNSIDSRNYFNFLLNRPFEKEILHDKTTSVREALQLKKLLEEAFMKRKELELIDYAVKIADQVIKIGKSSFYPRLTAVLDYGIQGEEYQFNNESRYWTASIIADWNIFKGGSDLAKIDQGKMEKKSLEIQKEELKQKIALQVESAFNEYKTSLINISKAEKQYKSMEESFQIIEKKYQEGLITYIEYLDTRTNYLNSEKNLCISIYDHEIKKARLLKTIGIGGEK